MADQTILVTLTSIEEIISYFLNQDEARLYRGHGCSSWKLLPGLFRNDEYSVNNIEKYDTAPSEWSNKILKTEGFELMKGHRLRKIEIRALKLFLKNISDAGLPCPFKGLEYAYTEYSSLDMKGNYFSILEKYDLWPEEQSLEYLALAQHYGIPTCLLDWSYNPFVSLFFAASGNTMTKDFDSDKAYMSIWSFDYAGYLEYMQKLGTLHHHEEDSLEYIKELKKFKIFNPSTPENKNISAQRGCFTYIARTEHEVGTVDIFIPLNTFFDNIKAMAEETQELTNSFRSLIHDNTVEFPEHEFPNFLTEVQIPKNLSVEIINALKKMGIFYPTIYPSYDSCVQQTQIDLKLGANKTY